ncbi:hypothetical protein FOZ61_010101 [Perkinsus olseni]|uniref:DUF155 domain-containing protein n=3 Tax=Perkinsus olseni TaxID=32597 RepID=A0A7J6M533_PEROL|nr:hypothetical protein FOL46_006158 [Perkinsus olseni]KAF4666161.1 hypothetical protein FOZ61_010101 [Perkinsus olseni]
MDTPLQRSTTFESHRGRERAFSRNKHSELRERRQGGPRGASSSSILREFRSGPPDETIRPPLAEDGQRMMELPAYRRRRAGGRNVYLYPQPEAYGRVAAVCIGESIDLDEVRRGWTQVKAGSRDAYKGRAAGLVGGDLVSDAVPIEKRVLYLTVCANSLDCYLFSFGCVVVWGASDNQLGTIVDLVRPLVNKPLSQPEHDYMRYTTEPPLEGTPDGDNGDPEAAHHPSRRPIAHDNIRLSASGGWSSLMERLAHSYSLAQSVRVDAFETMLDGAIERTTDVPETMTRTGTVGIGKKEVARRMGNLFVQRCDLNVYSDILGTPDVFWDFDEYEAVYDKSRRYMDINRRVEILNQRMEVLNDMYTMIQEELHVAHGNNLEIWVIWLVAVDAIVIGLELFLTYWREF